jgi:hypothetical protein
MIFGVCVGKNESTIKPTQLFLKNKKITMNEMMRKRTKNQISKMKMNFTFFFFKHFFFLIIMKEATGLQLPTNYAMFYFVNVCQSSCTCIKSKS